MNNFTVPKQRTAFMFMIRIADPGNHWIWLGEVSFFGVPIYLNPRTGMSQHVYIRAYKLFKNRSVSGYEKIKSCHEDLCVNPDHFEAPHNRPEPVEKAAPQPGNRLPSRVRTQCKRGHNLDITRRTSAGGKVYCAECQPPKKVKEYCVRGHKMDDTRRLTTKGIGYCGECSRVRSRERAKKRIKKGGPTGPVKEFCIRGHKLADTRKRTPKGAAYCVVCSKIRNRELRDAKKAKAAEV